MKINTKKAQEVFLEFFIIIIIFLIIFSFFDYTHWNGIYEDEDTSLIKKFINRYYFLTSTISSVGYGDISPKSYSCKLLVSILHIIVATQLISLIGLF